jgi:hypothetical protein
MLFTVLAASQYLLPSICLSAEPISWYLLWSIVSCVLFSTKFHMRIAATQIRRTLYIAKRTSVFVHLYNCTY